VSVSERWLNKKRRSIVTWISPDLMSKPSKLSNYLDCPKSPLFLNAATTNVTLTQVYRICKNTSTVDSIVVTNVADMIGRGVSIE
jgi:hypothetical protein